MFNERIRGDRSRYMEERPGPPFTVGNWYSRDASDLIVQHALLVGDELILRELRNNKKVFYWLVDESGFGKTHAFLEIDKDMNRKFIRMGDKEIVNFEPEDIKRLVIQRVLTNKQIENWGYLCDTPSLEDVKARS